MLKTKHVILKWGSSNKTWYVGKGYKFSKMGDEFEVNVNDLTNRCPVSVKVICDNPECKNPNLPSMKWHSYKRSVKDDGKYYCQKCAAKLYGGEKKRLTQLKNGLSFKQWCIDNNRLDVLNRWDYELNKYKPDEVSYRTKIKIYFKCERKIHNSELKDIKSFTYGHSEINCKYCNSFEQWCIDNYRQDVVNRWDYELNKYKPNEIAYASNNKYWFKCPRGIHESELKKTSSFTNGIQKSISCNRCNSFAQWCIDNNREDILSHWDYELNKYNPDNISFGIQQKQWFKCPKGIHESELKGLSHFTLGKDTVSCNKCNSFAQWGIDNICKDFLEKYWDYEKNIDIDPWKINKATDKPKMWIKCQLNKFHGSYPIVPNSFYAGRRCFICNTPKGEIKISNHLIAKGFHLISQYEYNNLSYLNIVLDNIFIPQKEFDGLIGLGNGNLSYDFHLPSYNLLVEFQGRFHDGTVGKNAQSEEEFKQQQEHDRRKREYAEQHNIKLLEIWYWNFDNIEEILDTYLI